MTNKIKYLLLIFVLFFTSCQENVGFEQDDNSFKTRFALSRLGSTSSSDDETITSLIAFRFEGESLKEKFDNLTINEAGYSVLRPSSKVGEIYFVANYSGIVGINEIQSLSELKLLELSGEEMTYEGVPMTGILSLENVTSDNNVLLKRSVARIDIDALSSGVEIKKVSISSISDRGMLWGEEQAVTNVDNADRKDRVYNFEVPLSGTKKTLCYIYEQRNDALFVTVDAIVSGGEQTIEMKLPQLIKRNVVYTIKVYGVGGELKAELQEADWGGEESINAGEQQLQFTVDVSSTSLPETVKINSLCDTVYIPYTDVEFDLLLNTIPGTILQTSGKVSGSDVIIEGSRNADNQDKAKVHIKNKMKSFVDIGGYVQLESILNGVSIGQIVLSFDSNPCNLNGDFNFDENKVCTFANQVEGEIGILSMPEGMRAELRFQIPENENKKNWMKLENISGTNNFRLLAGWCETFDPNMNGRNDAVQLVVVDEKTQKEDIYTIKRPFYSMPTVMVNNRYWTMFPMTGNSKNINEQIMKQIAPNELKNYLMTCTDEEFMELVAPQYQGGRSEAVYFQYDEAAAKFNYRGFSEAAMPMHSAKDEDMLPEGWRMPTQAEVQEFSFGQYGYIGYKPGQNVWYQHRRYFIQERNFTLNGHDYGKVYIWAMSLHSSSEIVFCSFRPQMNKNGLIGNPVILIAARGGNSVPWALEIDGGTFGVTRYQNWIGGIVTHTLHAIKKEVEYIYK